VGCRLREVRWSLEVVGVSFFISLRRPSSFVLRPSSFVLRPSSFVLRPSSCVLRPSSFVVHRRRRFHCRCRCRCHRCSLIVVVARLSFVRRHSLVQCCCAVVRSFAPLSFVVVFSVSLARLLGVVCYVRVTGSSRHTRRTCRAWIAFVCLLCCVEWLELNSFGVQWIALFQCC